MERRSKDSSKFCNPMTVKPALEGLMKYKLAKPQQASVVQLWSKACARQWRP